MNKLLRYSTAAMFLGMGVTSVAMADTATTGGGIKIVSDDGKFEAKIGGRIHFDGSVFIPDNSATFGGGPANAEKSSFFFRRVFLSLSGHLYGFEYHIDDDITGSGAGGFNDVWLAHSLLPGGTLYVGQHKPWRSLDELSSNNITPFQERNINSANGIFGGRDFTQGLYYKWTKPGQFLEHDNLWLGASFYTENQAAAGKGTTQALGGNARIAYAPIVEKTYWLHLGVNYSRDNTDQGSYSVGSRYSTFAGRLGGTFQLANYSPSANGGNPYVDIVQGEAAGSFGPAYLQFEYANAKYHQNGTSGDGVDAITVGAAYVLTGEVRGYSKGDASFGGIKPKHSYGAIEVVARYDYGKNNDSFTGCTAAPAGLTASKCQVTSYTFGINYYVNPAVRFLFDYQHGIADLGGTAGKNSPDVVMARAQIAF